MLRIEHACVLGAWLQREKLVFLHQRGEADHVREHDRCELPVQMLTHRNAPVSYAEARRGAAHVEILVMIGHQCRRRAVLGTGSVERRTQPVSVWIALHKRYAHSSRLRRPPLSY